MELEGKTIAIVGAGATGVSLFIQLIDNILKSSKPKRISIFLFEKENVVGKGVAFSPKYEGNILNMRAELMGISSERPHEFYEWIHKNNLHADMPENNRYFPRSTMGTYLHETFQQYTIIAKKNNIHVTCLNNEVFDISLNDQKFEIFQKNSKPLSVDYVALCIGQPENKKIISNNFSPNYFHQPWPDSHLVKSLSKKNHIAIIGTGLTAIDTAISLREEGETKQLYMISRNGWLPSVQGLHKPYTNSHLTHEKICELTENWQKKISLHDAFQLLFQEIGSASGKKITLNKLLENISMPPALWLKKEIGAAEGQYRFWQLALGATSFSIDLLWHWLCEQGKIDFLENFHSLWMSYRHAIPIQNANKILGYLEEGTLKIFSGLQSITFDEEMPCYKIGFTDRNQKEGSITANYLINSTGSSRHVDGENHTLLKNLLEKKILLKNTLGGVKVSFQTLSPLNEKNQDLRKFYIIGGLTCGDFFYTNALEKIAMQAQLVSSQIVENMDYA